MNTLAPYLLTALMAKPRRLVYLSSRLHEGGDGSLKDLHWEHRPWRGTQAYSDSKLHDVLLAFAVARHWPEVLSNALEPGWVPTRMGGPHAPDDLAEGRRTQVWLAVSEDDAARVSGEYFYHLRPRRPSALTRDSARQEQLLEACHEISGVAPACLDRRRGKRELSRLIAILQPRSRPHFELPWAFSHPEQPAPCASARSPSVP